MMNTVALQCPYGGSMRDIYYMNQALREAYKAYLKNEVPVGVVIVKDDKIIARAHNEREALKDPTAHAEIIAIRRASQLLGGWRLTDCVMYVTLEPCPMCTGAVLQSRIKRLVISTKDIKSGACGSKVNLIQDNLFNHNIDVEYGILENRSSSILKKFFKRLRKK